jgi:hypothetical protein
MDPLAYRLFPEATWRASLLHKHTLINVGGRFPPLCFLSPISISNRTLSLPRKSAAKKSAFSVL